MQFQLTEALLDDILFAMEDQMGEFMLDTVEGVVVSGIGGGDFLDIDFEENDEEGGLRYISLPDWDSSDGFRLMEHFTAGLRNPLIREGLTSALNLGRGVFRAFKDTLASYPEAEKLWFSFKDNEMKKEIFRWYNGLREEWGLEKIGMEPEETGDLVLEDFRFRPFRNEDISQAEDLHFQCLEEFRNTLIGTDAGLSLDGILEEAQSLRNTSELPFELGMVAESRNGELAGYVSGRRKDTVFYIQNLEVKAEFRGLGIGETLLVKFLESLHRTEIDQAVLDLPLGMEGFSRVLHRESFKPYMTRYWLKLRDRAD
jgi:predicted N-acetyltransferase YhbS